MKRSINLTEIDDDIKHAVFVDASKDIPEIENKINANTLEGFNADYFATNADVVLLQNTKADRDVVEALVEKVTELTILVNSLRQQ